MQLLILMVMFLNGLAYANVTTATTIPQHLISPNLIPLGYIEYQERGPVNADTPLYNGASLITPYGMLIIRGNEKPKYFLDDHWLRIPENQKIEVSINKGGQDIWSYPIGIELVHRIYSREKASQLIEVRRVIHMGGWWSYEAYYYDSSQNRLFIDLKASDRILNIENEIHGTLKIKISPIPTGSCRHCHLAHSEAAYQYNNEFSAGPCGFVPGHSFEKTNPQYFKSIR